MNFAIMRFLSFLFGFGCAANAVVPDPSGAFMPVLQLALIGGSPLPFPDAIDNLSSLPAGKTKIRHNIMDGTIFVVLHRQR
jgi:hypothetical protein